MKVYSVVGYDSYYPKVDNNVKCFRDLSEAEEFLKKVKEDENHYHRQYEIIEIEVY